MGMQDDTLIESLVAPEFFCDGLGKVEIVNRVATFVLFRARPALIGYGIEREVTLRVIMPVEAVGPAIELTVSTFGPRLVLPGVILAAKRLLM